MTISRALFPSVTVTVFRVRKIRIALRTNQIAGFVTVPSWKKISVNNTLLCASISKAYYDLDAELCSYLYVIMCLLFLIQRFIQ